jgi:hypothetical protein
MREIILQQIQKDWNTAFQILRVRRSIDGMICTAFERYPLSAALIYLPLGTPSGPGFFLLNFPFARSSFLLPALERVLRLDHSRIFGEYSTFYIRFSKTPPSHQTFICRMAILGKDN